MPWPALWRELFRVYPEASYILTTRNRDAWLKSVLFHFGATPDPVHQWVYGCPCPQGNESHWLRFFDLHNAEVLEFFAGRPSARFLHLVIDDGSSAENVSSRLREFLGAPPGPCVWGRVNSLADRSSLKSAAFNVARSVKYRIFGRRPIRFFGVAISNDYTDLM